MGCCFPGDHPEVSERRVDYRLFMLVVCILATVGGWTEGSHASPSSEEMTSHAVSGEDPSAFFPETAFDFGKVTPDREYEHTFTVMNVGAGDLMITKVVVG
jgi:hypothetical protein